MDALRKGGDATREFLDEHGYQYPELIAKAFTYKELAQLCGVSPRWLRDLRSAGKLRVRSFGGRVRLVLLTDWLDFLDRENEDTEWAQRPSGAA